MRIFFVRTEEAGTEAFSLAITNSSTIILDTSSLGSAITKTKSSSTSITLSKQQDLPQQPNSSPTLNHLTANEILMSETSAPDEDFVLFRSSPPPYFNQEHNNVLVSISVPGSPAVAQKTNDKLIDPVLIALDESSPPINQSASLEIESAPANKTAKNKQATNDGIKCNFRKIAHSPPQRPEHFENKLGLSTPNRSETRL
ncbi:hypothetical protein RUND412_002288 [Rhizina undulata]